VALSQVIAYTILDINRTTRLNEKPMTSEQQLYLQEMAKNIQQKSGASVANHRIVCRKVISRAL
jgi:hypothetical protein